VLFITLFTVLCSSLITWYSWEAYSIFGSNPAFAFCYVGGALFGVMIWVAVISYAKPD